MERCFQTDFSEKALGLFILLALTGLCTCAKFSCNRSHEAHYKDCEESWGQKATQKLDPKSQHLDSTNFTQKFDLKNLTQNLDSKTFTQNLSQKSKKLPDVTKNLPQNYDPRKLLENIDSDKSALNQKFDLKNLTQIVPEKYDPKKLFQHVDSVKPAQNLNQNFTENSYLKNMTKNFDAKKLTQFNLSAVNENVSQRLDAKNLTEKFNFKF